MRFRRYIQTIITKYAEKLSNSLIRAAECSETETIARSVSKQRQQFVRLYVAMLEA